MLRATPQHGHAAAGHIASSYLPRSLHKVTYTFLMNSAESCVGGQELCGHIFRRTRNENAFLEEEREGKKELEGLSVPLSHGG